MATIVTRAGKGSALSWTEADANFTNLNTGLLATATSSDIGIPCTSVHTGGAGVNLYTITAVSLPTGLSAALTSGYRFTFTPDGTVEGGAVQIKSTNFSTGNLYLTTPNGLELATYFDVQKGTPITVEYQANLPRLNAPGFRIVNQVMSFNQASMGHGVCKLQCDGATSISFTQDEGKGLLVWSPENETFLMRNFAVITNSSLFTAVNYVSGVANTALASTELYSVYIFDTDDGAGTLALDFWPMYDGGGEAWTPIVNEIGINVKRSTAGGSGFDNTRTYVGMLYTSGGSVLTALNGPTIISRCQSKFKLWRFPFVTDSVTTSGFTSTTFVTQVSPRVEFVTDGITDTGYFQLHCNHYSNGAGNLGEVKLVITGTSFNGSAFSAESAVARATTPAINGYVNLNVAWGVALPAGQYTVKPALRVNAGSGTFEYSLSGIIAL